jgi:hypothetical protein
MLTIPKLMEPLQIALAMPVLQAPAALVCVRLRLDQNRNSGADVFHTDPSLSTGLST